MTKDEAREILKYWKVGRVDKIKEMAEQALNEKEDKKDLSVDVLKEKYKSARQGGCKLTLAEYIESMTDSVSKKLIEAYAKDKREGGLRISFEEYLEKFGDRVLKE